MAKEQAQQIQTINNLASVCNVACQAYFTSGLSIRLADLPAGRSDRLRTITIS